MSNLENADWTPRRSHQVNVLYVAVCVTIYSSIERFWMLSCVCGTLIINSSSSSGSFSHASTAVQAASQQQKLATLPFNSIILYNRLHRAIHVNLKFFAMFFVAMILSPIECMLMPPTVLDRVFLTRHHLVFCDRGVTRFFIILD